MNTRDLFKIAFNSASEGLVVVDVDARIILVNARMNELFGFVEDEMIGSKIEMLIPTASRPSHVHLRNQYIESPHSRPMGKAGMELKGQRKDGSVFPVEVSLNNFEMDGKHYVLGLITDVSDRRHMEDQLHKAQARLSTLNEELEMLVVKRTAELRKSQKLYEVIAKNFPDGVINVLDQNFNYIFSEGRELAKLGYGSKDLLGTSYLSRLTESIRDNVKKYLLDALDGINQTCQIEVHDNFYELNIVGIRNDDELIEQILLVEINVTKQKRIEQEQERALAKERELGVMKSRFVSMASHEFRTPLSAILSSASLIEKYDKEDQQENRLKHTHRIRSSVRNLTDILNDFLSFDKLSSGAINPEILEVNVCEEVAYASEELLPIKKSGQQIELKSYLPKDCTFRTDRKILKNIFINLLSNGLKYSAENGIVTVVLDLVGTSLNIKVVDNGIGIPEADQERLFERFFRADNVANIQGTGLGLNIVKKYVEILGGTITFKSSLNEGTTFEVLLPEGEIEEQ